MSFASSWWQFEFKVQQAFPSLCIPVHSTGILHLLPELHLLRMLQDQPGRIQDLNAQLEGVHGHLQKEGNEAWGGLQDTWAQLVLASSQPVLLS